MRKILFIAYYFPPIGGSGTQRPVKFVKYLPELGWQPYVITTDAVYGGGAEGRDETLLADISPDVRVWRVPTPQPQPVNRLAQSVGWRSAAKQDGQMELASEGTGGSVPPPPSLTKRTRRAILSPLYLIQNPPIDPALYWFLRIVPLARRIIRQEQIDVVMTTVPPWSALLTGRLLQRLTGRPWVADFRDPWTDNTFTYFPTPAQHRLNRRLERHLIDRADAVISVTEPWVKGLQSKVSTSKNNKPFVLIPNGWDQDDFPDLAAVEAGLPAPESSDGRIVLLHPGSAYQGEPLPLLEALDRLAADGANLDKLRFHFVGYMHPEDQARITTSPQSGLFRLDPDRVPHDEALRLMRNAHVLLLLLRKGPDASSGKIFEYMMAGRPVLAIAARDGVAGRLVRSCWIGCAVDPDDIDTLATVLKQIAEDYGQFVEHSFQPAWSDIDEYERRSLTGKLAKVLNRTITTSATG